MLNFSIKELRASGQGKQDGVIEFDDGLNLIFGRSDTGKTWILKSINYLFGSSKIPIPSVTGYTTVRGVFDTRRFGRVTIEREIGSSKAEVTSPSPSIIDGEYETDYRKKASLYLNELWLRIIGIDEEVMIPKNENYERERLSWANIASVFFTDEDEIDGSDSIVADNPTRKTSVTTSLYYLLTKDNKKGIEKILSKRERTASKNAVTKYIDSQVDSLKRERLEVASELDYMGSVNIEEKMAELSSEIDFAQEETQRLLEENSAVANRMFDLQQRKIEVQVLIDRYESLLSQYGADLRRMGFIFEGEAAVRSQDKNEQCPFCGGHVETADEDSLQTIEAEAKRIASEMVLILATKSEVLKERDSLQRSIIALQQRSDEVQGMLDARNQDIANLEADLERFARRTTLSSRLDYIDKALEELGIKRSDVNKNQPTPKKFKAREEFETQVGNGFDDLLNDILKECGFTSGHAAWDFGNMDVTINGVPKSQDSGKGYRSFLNSAISLMLYGYFNSDEAAYKPGFMMIDTPLLGFDEDETLSSSQHLKQGLYNYFLNHTGEGQMIIVDNINVRPDLDFSEKAKVTVYKKNEADATTYGFLPDWRKDLGKGEK